MTDEEPKKSEEPIVVNVEGMDMAAPEPPEEKPIIHGQNERFIDFTDKQTGDNVRYMLDGRFKGHILSKKNKKNQFTKATLIAVSQSVNMIDELYTAVAALQGKLGAMAQQLKKRSTIVDPHGRPFN